MTNLKPAIKYFGSLNKTSQAIGLSSMAAHQWKKRGISPEIAVALSEASGGAFKPSELLPDFKWE
jgi:DNA-binding transcriptional regulator YdaS (Cro superfamily)